MDQQVELVTRTVQDNLIQILTSDNTVMATVGAPKRPQTRFPCFCIWQGEGELSDVPPVVLCVVSAAGSVAGGKDDEEGAWLGAVDEAKRMVLAILARGSN